MIFSTMLSLIKGAPRPERDDGDAPRDDLAPLVASVVRGEPEAVRTFVMTTGATVRRAARMVLGAASSEVDDVTQDAMIELLRALPRFRGECTVARFAARVAVLTAMAARRRRGTRERWVVGDGSDDDTWAAGPEASPHARVEAARRRDAVRRVLDELPEAVAETLALYFVVGHTVQEIAAASNVPVGTVASRLRVGKERLRQKLVRDAALAETFGASEDER
jgi:RNA polymerase sigma-70 factor (ECF subfamily)